MQQCGFSKATHSMYLLLGTTFQEENLEMKLTEIIFSVLSMTLRAFDSKLKGGVDE